MNKILKAVSLILLLSTLFSVNAKAANMSKGWYIIKHGNEVPDFPDDADFISEHSGFYIDKTCIDTSKMRLYLTFDAGYENGNISKILDILKDENVKAAFFILGNLIKKNPALVKRMADEGHLVCNHTFNHKDMSTLTKDEMVANLKRLEDRYRECTGYELARFFRFPEGRYTKDTVLTCEELGYKIIFWSMAYDDWDNSKQPSPNSATKKLLENTHNGAIILLHPTSDTNTKILSELIRSWKSFGYEFGTLDEL